MPMPVAFRYHLASLLAVFCALLIGILVGIALVGNPGLEQEAEAFRTKSAQYRATIRELQADENRSTLFAKQTMPFLIRGALDGHNIAIILNHDFGGDEFPARIAARLKSAGANVVSTTTILDSFMSLKKEKAQAILEQMGLPVPIEGDLRSALAAKLATHIAWGKPELPYRLRSEALIRVDGDYKLPADTVLLVGGAARGEKVLPGVIDWPMIDALQQAGKRCVGIESSKAAVSHVARYYRRRDIPTVDNADTAVGQLALVLVLAGKEGDFGEKEGALQLMPSLDGLARKPSTFPIP
jgi:hypothetical protein